MNWGNFGKLTVVLVLASIGLTVIHELLGVHHNVRMIVNPIIGAVIGFFSYSRWPIFNGD